MTEEVYHDDANKIAKLKAAADSYVKEHYSDTPISDIPQLDLETEAKLCVQAFDERSGNQVKGLGRLGDGLLTKLSPSSCRRRSGAAEVEEANQRVKEANARVEKVTKEALEAKLEDKQANDKVNRLEKFLMLQFPYFCHQTSPHSSDGDPDEGGDATQLPNASALDLGLT